MEYGYFAMKLKADDAKRKVAKIVNESNFLNGSLPKDRMVVLYDYMRQYYQNNTAWRSNFCSVWEKIHKALKIGSNASNQEKEKAAILTVVYANTPECLKKAKKGLLKLMRKNGDGEKYKKKYEQLAEEYGVSIQLIKCKTVKNPNNDLLSLKEVGALLPKGEWDE